MGLPAIKMFYQAVGALTLVALLACTPAPPQNLQLPSFAQTLEEGIAITQGDLRIQVLPDVAARLGSVDIAGQEILMEMSDKPWRWGNVLWSSPQSEWGWPPPPALDNEPYALEVDDESLLFTSGVDTRTGYQFTKRYRIQDDAIRITYSIKNASKQTKVVAPLELTRVAARGDVLFPLGSTAPVSGIFYPLKVNIEQGLCWFSYDAKHITAQDHYKIMLDGAEGWLAYRVADRILIKQFKDSDAQKINDNEREIELFAHSDKTYMEIKHQGPKRRLAPGKVLSWSVYWRGFELPVHLRGAVAPEEIADYVRKQLHRDF